jgi:hypothetical protein
VCNGRDPEPQILGRQRLGAAERVCGHSSLGRDPESQGLPTTTLGVTSLGRSVKSYPGWFAGRTSRALASRAGKQTNARQAEGVALYVKMRKAGGRTPSLNQNGGAGRLGAASRSCAVQPQRPVRQVNECQTDKGSCIGETPSAFGLGEQRALGVTSVGREMSIPTRPASIRMREEQKELLSAFESGRGTPSLYH